MNMLPIKVSAKQFATAEAAVREIMTTTDAHRRPRNLWTAWSVLKYLSTSEKVIFYVLLGKAGAEFEIRKEPEGSIELRRFRSETMSRTNERLGLGGAREAVA